MNNKIQIKASYPNLIAYLAEAAPKIAVIIIAAMVNHGG